MLRAVLAVALAAALVGVALPAVDRAGVGRGASLLGAEADRLARDAGRLAAGSDPVPVGARGARAVVALRLPGRSWATARVDYLAVGAARRADPPDGPATDVIAYRVAGGRERRVRLSVDVRAVAGVEPAPDDRALVLREPGRHVLALRLVRLDGQSVVLVERVGEVRQGGSVEASTGGEPAIGRVDADRRRGEAEPQVYPRAGDQPGPCRTPSPPPAATARPTAGVDPRSGRPASSSTRPTAPAAATSPSDPPAAPPPSRHSRRATPRAS